MTEPLKLKTNAEPTFWNKDMVLGTLICPVIGTLIGGYLGKRRMERERAEGITTTDKPSFWNKDMVIGVMLGGLVGTLLAPVVGTLVGVGFAAEAAALAVEVGMALLGMFTGSSIGKTRLANQHEQAKKEFIVEHISKTVSPEVGKALEYSMEHNKNWSKDLVEAKLLKDAQPPAIGG